MKKCEYIYADGFRFESGALCVDAPDAGGVMRRLAVVRDGDGASRLDRFKDNPREDGATGEIILKDLNILVGEGRHIDAHMMTATGRVTVSLDPVKAVGREGREGHGRHMEDVLKKLPEDQRVALAETQIYTMPYGIENTACSKQRLHLISKVLPDGAFRTAIENKSTYFLCHYDWDMAEHFRQSRPLDYTAIDIYGKSEDAAMLEGNDRNIRNAHIGAQILREGQSRDGKPFQEVLGSRYNNSATITAQIEMVTGLDWRREDQALLKEILFRTENDVLLYAALYRITDQGILNGVALEGDDPELRRIACSNGASPAVLAKVALSDKEPKVQLAATGRIVDQQTLHQIMDENTNLEVSMAALGRITDQHLLKKIARGGKSNLFRSTAVNQIRDSAMLLDIALDSEDHQIQQLAIANLTDQTALGQIADISKEPGLQLAAVNRITDQSILRYLAFDKPDWNSEAAMTSLRRLMDPTMIRKVSYDLRTDPLIIARAEKILNDSVLADGAEVLFKTGTLDAAMMQNPDTLHAAAMKVKRNVMDMSKSDRAKSLREYLEFMTSNDPPIDAAAQERNDELKTLIQTAIDTDDRAVLKTTLLRLRKGSYGLLGNLKEKQGKLIVELAELDKDGEPYGHRELAAEQQAKLDASMEERHKQLVSLADHHGKNMYGEIVGGFDDPYAWNEHVARDNQRILHSNIDEANRMWGGGGAAVEDITAQEVLLFIKSRALNWKIRGAVDDTLRKLYPR